MKGSPPPPASRASAAWGSARLQDLPWGGQILPQKKGSAPYAGQGGRDRAQPARCHRPRRCRRPHLPGRPRRHPRPPPDESCHRAPAPEDPQDHRADQDRAGGAGRQRGRVPEAGQQRGQAAGVPHQAGFREEEPEVGADDRAAAQEARALPQEAEGDRAERPVPAAQGCFPGHAPRSQGRGRQRALQHQRLRRRRGGGGQGRPLGAVPSHPHRRGLQAPGVRQPDPEQIRQRRQHRPPEGHAGRRAPRGGVAGAERQRHTGVQPQIRQRRRVLQCHLGLCRRQQLRGRARGFGEPQIQHSGQPPQQLRHHPGGAPGDQGQPVAPGGLHGGPQGAAAAGLHLHDSVLAGGALQVRAPGGAAERPHRAAPERNDQPEAGAGEHGGEGGLPVLREGAGHPGSGGVVPDAGDQAGAAAAAAAGGAAGRGGERQRPGAAGQIHQCHPGPDGRAARLRLHHRQLHHPAHEDPHAHPQHRPARPLPLLPLEALGLHHLLSGARPAPQLIRGPAAAAPGAFRIPWRSGTGGEGGMAAVWSLGVVSSHAVRSLSRPLLRLAAMARSMVESVPQDAQGGQDGERGGVWEETGRLPVFFLGVLGCFFEVTLV
nr:transmembrane and coiled-coil domains protein 2 isoform X2 [Anas platyrhynchos]